MENIYQCPKCGEKNNLHYNYDYSKQHRPVDQVLCNECGEIFDGSIPLKDIPVRPASITAVEMLELRYHQKGYALSSNDFQDAKKIEKDQLMDSFFVGGVSNDGTKKWDKNLFEEYYNKEYGNEV